MEGKQYLRYHDLPIWKKGFDLLNQLYTVASRFPKGELYGLTSQIQRSSNAIIANIAEAHGRYSYQDKIRVLYISRGELYETQSHLAVALARSYINKETFSDIHTRYSELAQELNRYITSLQRKKNNL